MQIQLRDKEMTIGKFGVEIEMFNVNRHQLVQALRDAGIEAAVESYGHETRDHWKLVSDASIRPRVAQRSGCSAAELVSPVLSGANGLNQVRTVCAVLVAHGAKVDMTCGLHVHHDATGFTADGLKKVVKVYRRVEKIVDGFMPKSRRDNRCRFAQSVVGINIDSIAAVNSGESFRRYYKVNLQSFYRHGTVEFRHHSGTVEADKVVNWVLFTALVVDKARGRVASDKVLKRWVDVKWYLGVTTDRISGVMKEMVKFYADRRSAFAAAGR